jgi:hypothetical protein
MSTSNVEAVVAGSKGFAVALLAPLTERVGVRPRIAADATQALALAGGPNGLAVLEVLDAATVAAIEAALPQRNGLRVIAAVPEALASLEGRLRAAGAELARWDGKPLAVLEAVTRATAAGAPPAPSAAAPPAPVRATPAPPRAPPAPAAGAGAALPPAPQPTRPAVAVPPGAWPGGPPAHTPRPVPAPGPAMTSLRPAATTPSRPMQPAGSALTPRPMQPVPPAPGGARPAAPPREPVPDGLFDELEADVDLGGVEPAPQSSARATPLPLRPAAAPEAPKAWPGGGPSPDEAEAALSAALAGFGDRGSPLGAVASQVATALSDLERSAIEGAPVPLDAELFRGAAGMRVRVAAALATLPPSGSDIDATALSTMLGEMDKLLSSVATLAKDASPDLMSSLEAVRNGLVKEAIDFSEAAQRLAPAGAAPIAEKTYRSARAAQARVLRVEAGDSEAPKSRRRAVALVLLGLAAAGAIGFHGYRYVRTQQVIAARPTLSGQPEGLLLLEMSVGGVRKLIPLRGATVDPGQLERFRAQQGTLGYDVQVLPGGAVEVRPSRGAGGNTR